VPHGAYLSQMRIWQTIHASGFGRHSHHEAYAAVVLSGGFEEAGDLGRLHVQAGDVVLHDGFEAHLDRFVASGAVVLNLRLRMGEPFTPGLARVADPDLIARTAEKDRGEAISLLLATAMRPRSTPVDWPDELAAALVQDQSHILSRWAMRYGLAPWTLSRGFAQVFGISPEAFRARARARRARRTIETTVEPLARIAADLGFSDQSHMSRDMKQLTGMTPKALRASANRFKTKRSASL
jgi:AraC-like DNA-binding protein